jgi:simple sugar transport system ATP-binding protein
MTDVEPVRDTISAEGPPPDADGARGSASMEDRLVIEVSGLVKRFAHVEALRGANFSVRPNEIVGLIGDNGAGKSTLIKALAGAVQADGGDILFYGRKVHITSPADAAHLGISTVYQDLALAPDLDPAGNVFLGRERARAGLLGRLGVLDKKAMLERTSDLFAELGIGIQNLGAPIVTLSGGQQQSVAVARSVAWPCKVVLLDEPTAALGVEQTRRVLELVRQVRDRGTSVVLISHNMPQIIEVTDRVEVLRLGRRVARFRTSEATMADLVAAMTGALSTETEEAE